MKRLLHVLCILGLPALGLAQGKMSIKGKVSDSTGVGLPDATMILMTPKDSLLESYSPSDKDGNFEFKNVKRAAYILKATYTGFLPHQQFIEPGDQEVIDLGTIKIKPIAKELMEVVIKTAKAPLEIKGDTISYNASSFKVPEGSTVEDLLRKLPGFEVDSDGSMKAQGRDVTRVTVDGKSFFGGDPRTATKTLEAKIVDKIKVFDGKSEQAKATGIDDGRKEKTVDIGLKEEYKNGGFGRVKVGAGTDERVDARANFNRFDEKQQFAFFGSGNNINQSTMNWDDRQDFYGSSSFRWDQTDFGSGGGISGSNDMFGSGGAVMVMGGGSIMVMRGSGGGDGGINNNYAGGVNYNYETKEKKFNSSYSYSERRNWMDQATNRQSILSGNDFNTNTINSNFSRDRNHQLQLRYENNIDSLNRLVVLGNGALNYANGNDIVNAENLNASGDLVNRSAQNNTNIGRNLSVNTSAIYRKTFKKKKNRILAASVTYFSNGGNTDDIQTSTNEFFRSQTPGSNPVQNIDLDLLNAAVNRQNQIRGSLSFVTPISKKFTWESFYNVGVRNDKIDRGVYNRDEGQSRNDTLSRYYTNQVLHNRLGTGLRFSHKGLNLMGQIVGLQLDMLGRFSNAEGGPQVAAVDKRYQLLLPQLGINYDLKNNRYFYAQYNSTADQPSIGSLQPIIDYSNPLFITQGNPNLRPEVRHSIWSGFSSFNPANFTNFNVNINTTYYVDQVVYNQSVDSASLVTRSKPSNVSGGRNFQPGLNYRFPIIKNKINLSVGFYGGWGKNFTLINDARNQTNTESYSPRAGIDVTLGENLTFNANASWTFQTVNYSINTTQNQRIYNASYNAQLTAKLFADIFLNTAFNLNTYTNDRFGLDQNIPILNFSVYRVLGKKKRSEIRLSGYDVFKRNLGISQDASDNFFTQSTTNTITRYFMLSYTFNLRGITASVRPRNNW